MQTKLGITDWTYIASSVVLGVAVCALYYEALKAIVAWVGQ
jgi:hypothetical protein